MYVIMYIIIDIKLKVRYDVHIGGALYVKYKYNQFQEKYFWNARTNH